MEEPLAEAEKTSATSRHSTLSRSGYAATTWTSGQLFAESPSSSIPSPTEPARSRQEKRDDASSKSTSQVRPPPVE